MPNTLPKPLDPVRFWFENAGRHLVSEDTRAALGADPTHEQIIKRSLASAWPRTKGQNRLTKTEAAIIGPTGGRIFTKTAQFPDSDCATNPDSKLEIVRAVSGYSLLVTEIVTNPPALPFLAICFDRGTDYGPVLRVTESLHRIHICSTKAETAITFDLTEVNRLQRLVERYGMSLIDKAVDARLQIDHGGPYIDKHLAQLDAARIKVGANMSTEELVWQMPAKGSGTLRAFRVWQKAAKSKDQNNE